MLDKIKPTNTKTCSYIFIKQEPNKFLSELLNESISYLKDCFLGKKYSLNRGQKLASIVLFITSSQ